MWACNACIQTCYRALCSPTLNHALTPRTATYHVTGKKPRAILAPWSRRKVSSLATYAKRNLLGNGLQCLGNPRKSAKNTLWLLQQPGQRSRSKRASDKPGQWSRSNRVSHEPGQRSRSNAVSDDEQKWLRKEMQYLKDPLKLAKTIVHLLEEPGNDDKAKAMVRMASRSMRCTVSWNHLIDFYMSEGRVFQAMSAFNEMKKRSQQPDGKTYTIVLRGLALHFDFEKSLERALTVYHSMYAPNSPVIPSVIHTNAALQVCAKAGDLDAMFGIAARFPKFGPRAADMVTYTTIFNALDKAVYNENDRGKEETLEENIDKRQKTVLQGRRMWAEVMERWKRGDILLDEKLVCAVGRLLLLADVPQDLDDVLSLLEQTMGIPRQIPRSSFIKGVVDVSKKGVESPAQEKNDLVQPIEPRSEPSADADFEFVPGDEFLPLPVRSKTYVVPDRSTLSLVLDACTRLKMMRAAQDYWGLLTGPAYYIVPDTANYHMYLRLLSAQRKSRESVELVQEMRDGLGVRDPVPYEVTVVRSNGLSKFGVRLSTFKIAIGACLRNLKNPGVMKDATKLLSIMYNSLPDADVKVMNAYVEIVKAVTARDWREMRLALKNTDFGVRQLRSRLGFGLADENAEYESYLRVGQDVDAFLRKLIGAYDYLLETHSEQMPPKECLDIRTQIRTLSRWQTEVMSRVVARGGAPSVENNGSANPNTSAAGGEPEATDHGEGTVDRGGEKIRRGERTRPQRKSPITRQVARIIAEGDVASLHGSVAPEKPAWEREAIEALRRDSRYTKGGRNKRMAMAKYQRRMAMQSM